MQYPWCDRELGFYFSKHPKPCPYCGNKITMAFKGKRVAALFPPVILLGWYLVPHFGGLGFLVCCALLLLPAAYVDKYY